jgi:hypothetical protein
MTALLLGSLHPSVSLLELQNGYHHITRKGEVEVTCVQPSKNRSTLTWPRLRDKVRQYAPEVNCIFQSKHVVKNIYQMKLSMVYSGALTRDIKGAVTL